jgi:hypothetical protein
MSEELQNLVTIISELKKTTEGTNMANEKKVDEKIKVFLKAATDDCG